MYHHHLHRHCAVFNNNKVALAALTSLLYLGDREQAEPAKENSLPTNSHSKQGEEFPKEALLENVHAAPPPIAMISLALKTK